MSVLFSLAQRLRSTRRALRALLPDGAPIRAALDVMDLARAVPILPDLESALSEVD